MSKIIGRTTATPVPRSDWNQMDETKVDFIKNKPELGSLAEKDVVAKSDLSSDVQTSLGKADIALDEAKAYTDTSVSGLASTVSVESALSTHNTGTDSHNDIRDLISGLTTRLNALANSDDTTLDQMAEVVAYIKSNRDLISEVTTNKVNVSDIIDNLTTNVGDKPLSAAQGVAIKALIDELGIELDTHGHDIGDVSGLQNVLDGKVPATRTVNGKPLNENISLVASDVGADASGTANAAMSEHNEDPVSHTDIRDALSTVVYINPEDNENIEDPQDTKIDEHNVSPDAHADIRNLITAAQTTADAALPKSGGTMNGYLTLNEDPEEELHAATKRYVDLKTKGSNPIHFGYALPVTGEEGDIFILLDEEGVSYE